MEQSIQGTSSSVTTNAGPNSVQPKKTTDDLLESESIDPNGLASFLQLLNQQMEKIIPATGDGNPTGADSKPEKIFSGNYPWKNEEKMSGEVMSGKLSSKLSKIMQTAGNADSVKEIDAAYAEMQNKQISPAELKEMLREIREVLLKNEDASQTINELPEQAKELNIPDKKTILENSLKNSVTNLAANTAKKNQDPILNTGDMREKPESTVKGNKISGNKEIQNIEANSFLYANQTNERVTSGGKISPEEIVRQVADGIKENINAEGGRVKITLTPPSLGTLEMNIAVHNDKVEVILIANNRDVQQTLNTNIDHLKNTLQNQGLIIDRCDVMMQSNHEDYPQSFNQQAFYQDGSEKKNNFTKDLDNSTFSPVKQAESEPIRISHLDSNNISVFA